MSDPLHYLPLERWSDLQGAFKSDWPRGITGYAVLESQKRLIEQGIDYGFKVYSPFDDVRNGMVAVNEKNKFYEIIILCTSDDTESLGDALRKTNIVDWKRSIIVPFAPHNVIECVKKVVDDMNVEIALILPSESFILDRKTTFEDVNLPPDITFGLLSAEHLNIVNSTWPHRYPTSPWYFELLINTKSGYGLFLNNTLISWVFVSESGTLLHMFTLEEQRQKGYAELLLKLVSNIMLIDNRYVIAFCLKDNVYACRLYNKVGFVKTEGVAWCYLNNKIK